MEESQEKNWYQIITKTDDNKYYTFKPTTGVYLLSKDDLDKLVRFLMSSTTSEVLSIVKL